MAKELARYIKEQLSQIPEDHPDRGYLEKVLKETKFRTSVPELVEDEHAQQRRIGRIFYEQVLKNIDDSTSLRELIFNYDLYDLGYSTKEASSLNRVLRALIRRDKFDITIPKFDTVGDVRNAMPEEILRRKGVGIKGAVIASEAFRKPLRGVNDAL